MKKIIVFIVLFLCINPSVNAQTFEFDVNDEVDLYKEIYDDFVGDSLKENLPEDIFELSEKMELSPSDPFSFNNLFCENGFEYLKTYVFEKINFPIKTILIILSTILICAICSVISSNNLQAKQSLDTISILSIVTLIILPINNLIAQTANIINVLNSFMMVFIPIFAGVLIAGLKSGTASVFSSLMFFLCQIISNVSKNIILPFSNCYVALSIAQGISINTKLRGITRIIRKSIYILISLSMAIFIAVLSFQTTITSAVDNVGTKTAKFFISSFVPIIGPSLSESLNGLRGCVSVLKSSIGIYVIIIIFISILPVCFEICIYKLMFTVCSDISDMYDIVPIRELLNSINQALSIFLSIILCVSILFVFSITIIFVASRSV